MLATPNIVACQSTITSARTTRMILDSLALPDVSFFHDVGYKNLFLPGFNLNHHLFFLTPTRPHRSSHSNRNPAEPESVKHRRDAQSSNSEVRYAILCSACHLTHLVVAMEDIDAFSTQSLLNELELSREPPESISARSLGQAADVLTTPRKTRRLSSPRFTPEFVYRSPRHSSFAYVDAVGSLGATRSEPTTGDGERASLGQRWSPISNKSAALTTPPPLQRQESAEVAEVESQLLGIPLDDACSSTLREHEAVQYHASPHPANSYRSSSVPIPVHLVQPQGSEAQFLSGRNPNNTSPHDFSHSPLGDRQQERPTLSEEPLLNCSESQAVAQLEERSRSIESQSHIPGGLPTHDDEFLPQWAKTTFAFLLSLAKRLLLHFIPHRPSTLWSFVKSALFLLLSLAHVLFVIAIPKICGTLRHGLIRGYTWCARRRPTPARPIPEGPNPGPRDSEPTIPSPDTQHASLRSQCDHCYSDYANHTIIHCPRRHAVCVDCLSSYVARQAPHLAHAANAEVVCLHPSGCEGPFDAVELQRLPEGVLRQLLELVHSTSISVAQQSDSRGREMAAKVKAEPDENEVGQSLLSGGRDASARIEDAISRCSVSLRKHSEQPRNHLPSLPLTCSRFNRIHQRRT